MITRGMCFGGISFLLSSPRAVRAVALEDTEVVMITRKNINGLMNDYPEFVLELLREMAERVRKTNKSID